MEFHLQLLKELWLAVDEVVHHDDVMVAIVIRSRGNIAGFDPYPRDASVIKHDAEEGQVSVARRSRDETAEQQSPSVSKYSISVLALRFPRFGRACHLVGQHL